MRDATSRADGEFDRFGEGDRLRVDREGPTTGEGRRRPPRSSASKRATTDGSDGRPGDGDDLVGADDEAFEFGKRRFDLADQPSRPDVEKSIAAGRRADRDDRAVGRNP